MALTNIEKLADLLPEAARDLRINLVNVLQESSLSEAQRFGVALTSAWAARSPRLAAALLADAEGIAPAETVDDAKAAAALMGMNNVLYRFRHLVGKEAYGQKPARLRMQRIGKPAASKADFELFSLAASAIKGCEVCVKSHEAAVLHGGLSEDQVFDAIRIASTIHGAAIALEIAG